MKKSEEQKSKFKKNYTGPLWVALLSIAGLVSALLGNGLWDFLSWLLLSGVFSVGCWKIFKVFLKTT